MNICIIYDTRREKGATKHIVKWLSEELFRMGGNVDIVKPGEIDSFDYDLFIIGSPIYWEKPLKNILDFLSNNADNLRNKRVALFIVCLTNIFGKLGEKYVKNVYLKPLLEKCSGKVIEYHIFRGWMWKPDYSIKEDCIKWVKKLVDKTFKY
ncbi:MAG TPA: hypothetical protein ENG40_02760 [Thermoprotei archaeon]|nr:hypothetical protein [Thermoprotei archaeon]